MLNKFLDSDKGRQTIAAVAVLALILTVLT